MRNSIYEQALTSVLALDYPRVEIIVLDDRSTDTTPVLLERMAARHPQLRVVPIRVLPSGWLGKNHALHLGAEQAGASSCSSPMRTCGWLPTRSTAPWLECWISGLTISA